MVGLQSECKRSIAEMKSSYRKNALATQWGYSTPYSYEVA
jgi:hypothetical protein